MALYDSKIVNWSQYQQIGLLDLNNISKFLNDSVIKDILYKAINNNIAVLMSSGIVIQETGSSYNIYVSSFLGISAEGETLINKNQVTLAHTVPTTNPRIDIIECAAGYVDQSQQSRNFVDPITGNVAPALTYTEKGLQVTLYVKEGIEGTGVAPVVTAGRTKLAEVYVDLTGGIANTDIRNVDKYFGESNTGWTIETTSTHLFKDARTHRESATLDHPDNSVTEEKLSVTVQNKLNSGSNAVAYAIVFGGG